MLTILRNAQVFSPAPLGVRDLVIAAGRIVWLGESAPVVGAELVAEEVDLGGVLAGNQGALVDAFQIW